MVTIDHSDDEHSSVVFVQSEDVDQERNAWSSMPSNKLRGNRFGPLSPDASSISEQSTSPFPVSDLGPDYLLGESEYSSSQRDLSASLIASSTEERESEGESDEEERRLNTPHSLSKGKISSGDGKTEYNILLVGETGVGKTTLLTFLWNVLNKRMPSEYILNVHDVTNESGLHLGASQTNDAKLYTFTSQNGIVLRVLDTPGLSDTRGVHMDEQHKRQIAQSIKDLVVSVDAVLIMANGTNPRLNVSTSYALTTLSSMFPKSLVNNIGMLFTNVSDPLSWNFEKTSLPHSLQNAKAFTFHNPTSLESRRRDAVPLTKWRSERKRFEKRVTEAHEYALETFADLLDWIDSRSPQPTNDIIALYEYSLQIERQILNTQSQLAQALTAQGQLKQLQQDLIRADADIELYKDFESIVHRNTFELVSSSQASTICHYPGCNMNCHINCGGARGFWWWVNPRRCFDCWGHTLMFWVYPACKCGHDYLAHRLSNSKWQTKEDTRVAVDQESKEKYFEAKTQKDRNSHVSQQVNLSLVQCSNAINTNMEILAELAQSYSTQSLSGNYASQLEEGIKLSREVVKTMRANGNDRSVMREIENQLAILEKKLKVLRDAQAKKREKVFQPSAHTLSDTITGMAANARRIII